MDIRPPLTELIQTTAYWLRTDTGLMASNSPFKSDTPENLYSIEEFGDVHPNFIDVLEDPRDAPLFAGNLITWSLDLWTQPTISLPTLNAARTSVVATRLVKVVSDIDWAIDSDVVIVECARYNTATTKTGVRFADYVSDAKLLVPSAWLNENYPGLQNRYLVAKSLDLDPAAMTALLFNTEKVTAVVSMPDQSLD